MPRILICDTYYGDFLRTFQVNAKSTYEAELRRLLDCQFGTADFYSRNLRKLGWDAIDIIANCRELQETWARGYFDLKRLSEVTPPGIVKAQIGNYEPGVVFMQDLSFLTAEQLAVIGRSCILAGQLSCPWPGDERVKQFDVLFTSFPHYVPRIEKLGVRVVYNPLAFDISGLKNQSSLMRYHECIFVGGVGAPSHWQKGMELLNVIADEVPEFQWWGYGADKLPVGKLREKYKGEAWGREMYYHLCHAKIVVNRHGEVAQGYANNMRLFEVTGCGALLITEDAPNIRDFFAEDECVTYSSPQDAVDKIRYYMDNQIEATEIAGRGMRRTLRDHTYEKRMATVSATLQEMLCPA